MPHHEGDLTHVEVDAASAVLQRIREDPVLTGDRFVQQSEDAEVVIPGVMYRYREWTKDRLSSVTLTVYIGVGELGAALWQQEIGALERISGLAGGALPDLLDSGYLPPTAEGPGATYVRTRAADAIVEDDGDSSAVAAEFMARPTEALRHLWLLADALAVVHDCRIIHRNIWPHSIQIELTGEGAESDDPDVQFRGLRVQLTRFEMSGMISNMLRGWRPGQAGADDIRNFMLEQPLRSRAFAAPERLRFMFGEGRLGAQDFAGDVFGLGMIAVEWLLGPETLGSSNDYVDLASLLALQERVRAKVSASDLPAELRTVIGDMISPTLPRPTAHNVVATLGRVYDASLLSYAVEAPPAAPYLVAFMPGSTRSDKTLLRWGYLSRSTDFAEGTDELRQLIQSDMRGGRVMHSPDGAAPYVMDSNTAETRKATTVIEGREFVWFLMRMFKPRGIGKPAEYNEVQVVRYVVERNRMTRLLQDFLKGALSRTLHDVQAVNFNEDKSVHDARVTKHPSWQPLLDSIKTKSPAPSGVVDRQRAMEWYVDYQTSILRSREYAYRVTDSSVPGRPQIIADEEADTARTNNATDPLLRYILSDPSRPSMRDFILFAGEEEGQVRLQLAAQGSRLSSGAKVKVHSVRDRHIVLDAPKGVPSSGWLRLADDGASSAQVRNQAEAVAEMSSRRDLLYQLANPHSSPRSRHRWGADVSRDLVGEGAEIVREMLAHETFFVLQGPPGTGKTTITSHAIAAYLDREAGARILVSAQSHDALDNLAERILGLLKLDANGANGRHTALRVASQRREDSVSDPMKHYLEANATEELVHSIRTAARRGLHNAQRRSPELAAIIEEWITRVDNLGLDLRLRLRRGANLVFATTGASTVRNLVSRGSNEPFDWVVIEEAARAWPSELALPMTRGTRWTLVGDQAQIGAYGRSDIQQLLERFEHDPDPDLRALFDQRDALAAGFDLFAGFFDEGPATWRRTLHEQHRMDERVAEVVSRTFYKESGGLSSPGGRRSHGLKHPEWLSNESIVWIDTGNRKRAVPSWSNDEEARDVATIVRRIAPEVERARQTIAVLTPYREQRDALSQSLGERTSSIFTIDGYQGREADVIVASLVRDHVLDPARPWTNAGHLTNPGRANVLMSRARSLLILVGNLDLFESNAGPDWEEMVATIRRHGRIVPLWEAELS